MTTKRPSVLMEGPYTTRQWQWSFGQQQWWTSRPHQQTNRAAACAMDVSTEKSKIKINSMNNISADISLNDQKQKEVTSFKYLEATLWKDGTCLAEICIRIASAIAAMARLNRIWWCFTISFACKFKLYKSVITSILLYGRETWTLLMLADSEKKQRFRLSKPSASRTVSESST